MIKETLKVHGERRLEIKRRISFPETGKSLKYHVETWYFLPTNLQVNRWTFPPQTFPQYLKNYIRLRPPTASIADLLEPESTLESIERCLDSLIGSTTPNAEAAELYEKSLKLFCLTYKRSLRLAIRDAMRHSRTPQEREEKACSYMELIKEILRRYRDLFEKNQLVSSQLRSPAYVYCDEFLAIITTHYCFKLLVSLEDGERKDRFRTFWRAEMAYRDKHYHESIAISDHDNEIALYRWGVLKKYVNAPLFLELRRKMGQTFVFHMITSVAAAVAMVFATAVAFIWQVRYGAVSTPLFVAMVIGYIFKDKMKELSREKLFSIFRKWLPDRRLIIYKDLDRPIGTCEEAFSFVGENRIPEDVRILRDKSHLVDVLNSFRSEDILYYSRVINLTKLKSLFPGAKRSIMDISRLDISPFFRHVDDMGEELPTLDAEDITREDKAYHVNIIRRVTIDDIVSLERMRVVITHKGIKRIDSVVRGEREKAIKTGAKLTDGNVLPQDTLELPSR